MVEMVQVLCTHMQVTVANQETRHSQCSAPFEVANLKYAIFFFDIPRFHKTLCDLQVVTVLPIAGYSVYGFRVWCGKS